METIEDPAINDTIADTSEHLNPGSVVTTAVSDELVKTNGSIETPIPGAPHEIVITNENLSDICNEGVPDNSITTSDASEVGIVNIAIIENCVPKIEENIHTTTEVIIEESSLSTGVETRDESDSVVGHIIEISDIDNGLNTVSVSDNVTFETEILVENNDDTNEEKTGAQDQNNILNELGENIGLSEVLCSSESVESSENNNSTNKYQVLNNEELLDILEGNDMDQNLPENVAPISHDNSKSLERQLALQQLSRLKTTKKRKTSIDKNVTKNINIKFEEDFMPSEDNLSKSKKTKNSVEVEKIKSADILIIKDKIDMKHPDKEVNVVDVNVSKSFSHKDTNIVKGKVLPSEKCLKGKEDDIKGKNIKLEGIKKNKKKINIVNALVQDWDDDEPMEENSEESSKERLDLETSEQDHLQQNDVAQDEVSKTVDSCSSPTYHESPQNVGKDDKDGPSQKRQSRVIKKKVIFDPDNPDTFTKSKTINKGNEVTTDSELQPPKKIKVEQTIAKSNIKSPLSKLKWKKPASKTIKQNKRLSEVDKLLMDEGAVNMIYQLTPEAPKGRKNVKTKAEFIKRIQSSTPDSKEMKFRERKKDKEEDEAKKILGGKHRISLSSSVKSPSVCEDFETHSADDSIIYRRHSSSSYSSTGMSPRRLSEVDVQTSHNSSAHQKSQEQFSKDAGNSEFMAELTNTSNNEIIKKEDCVSIKEKLNSKLSLALKKKKSSDGVGNEKPAKRKKNVQSKDSKRYSVKYDNVIINFENRLAEIYIRKTGSQKYNVEVLTELRQAFEYIENSDEVCITLLTSQCGTLCSNLDLRNLMMGNLEKKTDTALKIAEAVRSLLVQVEQHSKLLCTAVWGACSEVGLALVALSDLAIASEHATFSAGASAVLGHNPPLPGISVLSAQQRLSQSLINDVIIFGRKLAASEALNAGLIHRVLWPQRFMEQVRAIVKDIAAQPPNSLLLKKQLLRLNKQPDFKATYEACLEAEKNMLAEYWLSAEGQEMLRTYYDVD